MDEKERAFPYVNITYTLKDSTGMDLRDYFAAKAMQAHVTAFTNKYPDLKQSQELANESYKLADIMMKVRE